MTSHECLDVWRELLHVTRLLVAVQTVTQADGSDQAPVWRAAIVALEQRRGLLAYVLSLEDQALLESVYARLAEELRSDRPLSIGSHDEPRVH